tara:strand:+ start:3050 stop:6250 length:3201 start_codon:yes stop_codon:yes gene_type:complete
MFKLLRESIAAKITLLIILLVMFSASFVGMIFYFRGVSYFTEVEINKIDSHSQSIEDKINQFYSTIEQQSYAAYHVQENVDNNNFINFLIPFKAFSYGTILKPNGETMYFDRNGFSKDLKKTIPFNQFNINLSTLPNGNFISRIYLERKNNLIVDPLNPLISVFIKTKNYPYGIFFNYDVKILFKVLKDVSSAKQFEILLFDKFGKIIIHPNSVKNFSTDLSLPYGIYDEFNDVIISDNGNDFGPNFKGIAHYKGDEKVLVAKFVTPPSHPNIQIGFAIFSSYNRILSGLKFIRSQSIAISFLLILLTAFVGWYVVKYLLKNLNTITDSAKRYTQGESDINIKVNSSDEIGTLALTFQGMIRQVNERARVLRKSERTIREARDQAEKALNSKSQLLDDIKRQNEEIETMAKDKDELLAIVSHDLKNPLAIVETSMDILLEEAAVKGNSQIKDLVRRSKTNARYALNLITDLLDLARMEGGIKLDFDVFNVNEMIETILDSMDIKAKEKNISFITNFDGTYNIKADYGRIVQVINNVVGNALKFVPKDGTIKIILEKFESNRKVDGNSSFLRIKIEDNGPGIPKSKLKTIFNKFSQARESDRKIGTGLGLAICENIVGKHTGSIMVESVEGHGATFIIDLPRVVEATDTAQETNVVDISTSKKELPLIYIYETNNEFRESLTQFITQSDYRVISFASFENLCDRVNAFLPDIILFDVDKSKEDDSAELIAFSNKEAWHDIPIVATSEFISEKSYIREIGSVHQLLPKDNNFEAYLEEINKILYPAIGVASERYVDVEKKTILVVDEEEVIRELIMEMLEKYGYNAISAKGGTEAIFLFKKYDVDLVITDLRMQEMDGMALTRLIRSENADIPILLMSANISSLPHDLIEKLKVTKLVSKPFDLDMLASSIGFLLGNEDSIEVDSNNLISNFDEVAEEENYVPNLLLVDDSEDMNLLFKVMLKGVEVNLDYANDGKKGLSLYKENSYDYVFLDMKMPGMTGDQVLKEMKKIDKKMNNTETSFFVISANSSPKDLELYKKLGFDKALNKPINKNKIIDAISGNNSKGKH